MPAQKSKLPKNKLRKLNHKFNKLNSSRDGGLKDPPIKPARIASLLNVSPRKESYMWADRSGPPCWYLGRARVSTVATVEQWIAEQSRQAAKQAFSGFRQGRLQRSAA